MTPDTLNFQGDIVTVVGFIGIFFAAITLAAVFNAYSNSPYRK